MSFDRRIFLNTLAQGLGKVVAIAVGLLTLNLLTRFLAERGFGQYSTVVAFLGFFVVLADLGLYLIVTREISKDGRRAKIVISNALGLRLVASVVFLFLGSLLALLFPYDRIVKETIFVGMSAFIFVSLNQVLMGVFQKHLVTHLPTIAELLGRVLNLILVFLFVQQKLPLPFFIIALTAGNGLSFLLTLWFARRYELFGLSFDLLEWKRLLAASWPLMFAVILNLLYFKTDTIILSVFRSAEAVGVYGLPYKILEVLLAFPAMFVGLFFPMLSATAFSAPTKFNQILQKAFNGLLLAIAPMVTVTWFFSQPIINLIKGPREYTDSAALLQILIIATAIMFLGTLFGYAVTAINRQKAMVWGYLLGAIAGLALYFVLIPRFGYFGAAYGTVITELLVAAYAYRLLAKADGGGVSWRLVPRILPPISIMAGFFYFFSLPWFGELTLGVAIYVISLFVFRAVRSSTLRELFLRT